MKHFACVYIGLGSNLDAPLEQVQRALKSLAALPASQLIATSPWYQSRAQGPGLQNDYINGVAQLHTQLPPLELLDHLQAIESAQQRVRDIHWGPRTLDLDVLLYDNLVLQQERLTLPHPFLSRRNFVLMPLHDLAPELVLPDGQPLAILCTAIGWDGLTLAPTSQTNPLLIPEQLGEPDTTL